MGTIGWILGADDLRKILHSPSAANSRPSDAQGQSTSWGSTCDRDVVDAFGLTQRVIASSMSDRACRRFQWHRRRRLPPGCSPCMPGWGHAQAAGGQARRLDDRVQFHNECDSFTIDPVAYAPALGAKGGAAYRARLDEIPARSGLTPDHVSRWPERPSREWGCRTATPSESQCWTATSTPSSAPTPMTDESQPG